MKDRILQAAAKLFAERSADAVSMRAVARAAGVDVALVSYYFGSKAGLFQAVVGEQLDLAPIERALAGAQEVGPALVMAADGLWSSTSVLAVMRKNLAGGSAQEFARLVKEVLAPVVAPYFAEDSRDLRLSLAMGQMVGLAITRHLLRIDPIAGLSRETLARYVGPTIQRYAVGDLDEAPAPSGEAGL